MLRILITLLMALGFPSIFAQGRKPEIRENIPLDSIRLSDPCIQADKSTATYYMTGTGGLLWKSKDLSRWTGPYVVTQTDPESWMGPQPMIWAAELHQYRGKYYYFATFTNRNVNIDTVRGNVINRRASHVLVSEQPGGPYVPMEDDIYLPADKPTLDGTFWVDRDGKPYMIYCYEWLQNWNGTWVQEAEPVTPPNFGHGMLFRTFEGKLLMSVHSHKSVNGRTVRIPHLFEVDDSGDKLVIKGILR